MCWPLLLIQDLTEKKRLNNIYYLWNIYGIYKYVHIGINPSEEPCIEPYNGSVIEPYNGTIFEPYNGIVMEPYNVSVMEPYNGSVITLNCSFKHWLSCT